MIDFESKDMKKFDKMIDIIDSLGKELRKAKELMLKEDVDEDEIATVFGKIMMLEIKLDNIK